MQSDDACGPRAASAPAPRRTTREVHVGDVTIGSAHPIAVQSMTNTPTADRLATITQIEQLVAAGCELVRVAVPDMAAVDALRDIKRSAAVPVVADIHFDHRLALAALDQRVDKLRINPGNIGGPERVLPILESAKDKGVAIRIGVNAGSLHDKYTGEPDVAKALVMSALEFIRFFEDHGMTDLVVSVKSSSVPVTIEAYRLLARQVDYPLHLGVTEAGTMTAASVKSAVGLGVLLAEGIGDTLRVSITADPVREIAVAYRILQSLHLRSYGPEIIACPTCARCEIDLIGLAEEVEKRLSYVAEPLTVAVMGCVVNGPGEAREADVGIAAGKGSGVVFRGGEMIRKVSESELLGALLDEVELVRAQMRQGSNIHKGTKTHRTAGVRQEGEKA